MLRKETKGKGEGRRKKKNLEISALNLLLLTKGASAARVTQERCSEQTTKLKRQDECSSTARIGSPRATGVPPGETGGKGK